MENIREPSLKRLYYYLIKSSERVLL